MLATLSWRNQEKALPYTWFNTSERLKGFWQRYGILPKKCNCQETSNSRGWPLKSHASKNVIAKPLYEAGGNVTHFCKGAKSPVSLWNKPMTGYGSYSWKVYSIWWKKHSYEKSNRVLLSTSTRWQWFAVWGWGRRPATPKTYRWWYWRARASRLATHAKNVQWIILLDWRRRWSHHDWISRVRVATERHDQTR